MGIHPARHAGDRKSKRQGLCKVWAGELGAGRDKGQYQPYASAPLLIQRQDRGRPAAGGGGKRKPPGACVCKVDDGDSKGGLKAGVGKDVDFVHGAGMLCGAVCGG